MSLLSVQHGLLGVCFVSRWYLSKPQKVDTFKSWPVPLSAKELHSFWGLASYYHCLIPKFAAMAKCLQDLVGPTNVKRKTKEGTRGNDWQWQEIQLDKQTWGGTWPSKDSFDECASARLSRYFPDLLIWIMMHHYKGWVAVLSQRGWAWQEQDYHIWQ